MSSANSTVRENNGMNATEYLKNVAYIKDGEYRSKFDDSYIILVGMEGNVQFLADREITKELTHGVGYSPKDGKWYGWSHRAIYGFKVGSTCKKGDCHYVPATPEELIDAHAEFFADLGDEYKAQKIAECKILDDRSGIRILVTPIKLPMVETIDELVNVLGGTADTPEEVNIFEESFYEIKCGRGEWVAETMEDAKQMAKDFSEGVS